MYLESNTPSAIVKNQSNSDLEEWLKNNKPTVIPPGVSLGEVKWTDSRKGVKPIVDSEPKIIEKNKKVRAVNENRAKEAQERAEQRQKKRDDQLLANQEKRKQRSIERINEQQCFIQEFMQTAIRGDAEILAKLTGVYPSAVNKARYGLQPMSDSAFQRLKEAAPLVTRHRKKTKEMKSHYNSNVAARKQAITDGKSEYTAVCSKHGETLFKLHANHTGRCRACQTEKRDKAKAERRQNRNPDQLRMQNNFNAMMVAVENGQRSFTGVCDKHGEGEYSIKPKKKGKSNHMYKCCACIQQQIQNQQAKRRIAKAKQAMI